MVLEEIKLMENYMNALNINNNYKINKVNFYDYEKLMQIFDA